MNVTTDITDPYSGLIKDAVMLSFPTVATLSSQQLLDAITTEFVSTGSVRYGPMPNVESLFAIRKVIKFWMDQNLPIAVLIPWGSMKPNTASSIDVAELMALKMINCLQQRILSVYKPGISVNLRIEDASGFYMFRDISGSRESSEKYCSDLVKMINILNPTIKPILESNLSNQHEFLSYVQYIQPIFLEYLTVTDAFGLVNYQNLPSWKELEREGWCGNIPLEQRQFYYKLYECRYQSDPNDQKVKYAEYSAQSLARYKMGWVGTEQDWGTNYVQINFAPPVPDAPIDIVGRHIHYRTIHTKYSRDHLPPWRAKGYYRIHNDNSVTPAVTSWRTRQEYQPFSLRLSEDEAHVEVQADYIIVD